MRTLIGIAVCVGAFVAASPTDASAQLPGCSDCEFGSLQDGSGNDCYHCGWGHPYGYQQCATPSCTQSVRSTNEEGGADCSLVPGLDGRAQVSESEYAAASYEEGAVESVVMTGEVTGNGGARRARSFARFGGVRRRARSRGTVVAVPL